LAVRDLLLLGEVELCRTVAVERPAKAALLELPDIVVEVGGREPIRERIRISEAIEISGVCRLVRPRPLLPAFTGSRIIDLPKRRADVRLKLRFRHAGLLEIELIEKAVLVQVSEQLDTRRRSASGMGNAQPGDRAIPIRKEQRRVPHSGGAPIMVEQDGLLLAETLDKARDVGAHLLDRVGLDRITLVASAISAHVDGGHPIARFRKRCNLMAPRVPAFRPAMHQHDERSASSLRDPQPNAVGVDEGKFRFRVHRPLRKQHRLLSPKHDGLLYARRSFKAMTSKNDGLSFFTCVRCFDPTGKSVRFIRIGRSASQAPPRKILFFRFSERYGCVAASRRGTRGVCASSRNVRRDAMDALASPDERRSTRTAKSCGPDTPTLV